MQNKFRYFGAAAIAAAILIPGLAFASHGKAGLWQMTVTVDMPGMTMPQMPDMSKMPPEVQERMKAMQLQMSNHTISVQHCMTAQEVSMDKPDFSRMQQHTKDCTISNEKISGHSFSADMTCSGDFQGTGHVSVAYDSDEHYSGESAMSGASHGHPMNMKETFDGKWVSADCGAVKN